jgi:osmotically-inducible protein OsmY
MEVHLQTPRRTFMKILSVLPLVCAVLIGCRTNESPKAQVDDLQITAQVKSQLVAEIGLSSVTDISINSTNGIVTLSGQVDSPEIKNKAEASARSVPKVVRVINNLQVAVKPK